MKKAIDVSKYQGNIDWTKVKKSGVECAILRAGWGQGNLDGSFKRNADECAKLGMPFGIYWFSYAYTAEMARREAMYAMNAVKGYTLALPICFDFEYDSVSYAAKKGVSVTKALASSIAKAFLDECRKAGYLVANYTNIDYYKRYFNDEVNKGYDVWLAMWGRETAFSKSCAMWQYTSKGKVDGIAGNVDMDYIQKDYMAKSTGEKVAVAALTPAKDYYKIPASYQAVFDAQYYLDRYSDLQDAVRAWIKAGVIKNTPEAIAWQLFQHFLTYGMNEARQGNSTFDARKYKAAYTDLQAAYGDEWKPYYYHYILCGQKEIAEGKRQKWS